MKGHNPGSYQSGKSTPPARTTASLREDAATLRQIDFTSDLTVLRGHDQSQAISAQRRQ
jgi:hypothetical protein